MAKQYAEPQTYEAKLERIMTRLGIERYDYDWSRLACWVEFTYKGSRIDLNIALTMHKRTG